MKSKITPARKCILPILLTLILSFALPVMAMPMIQGNKCMKVGIPSTIGWGFIEGHIYNDIGPELYTYNFTGWVYVEELLHGPWLVWVLTSEVAEGQPTDSEWILKNAIFGFTMETDVGTGPPIRVRFYYKAQNGYDNYFENSTFDLPRNCWNRLTIYQNCNEVWFYVNDTQVGYVNNANSTMSEIHRLYSGKIEVTGGGTVYVDWMTLWRNNDVIRYEDFEDGLTGYIVYKSRSATVEIVSGQPPGSGTGWSDWVLTQKTGNWVLENHTHWKSPHDTTPATLVFRRDVNNLNLWSFGVVTDQLKFTVEGLWELSTTYQVTEFNVTDFSGTKSIVVRISLSVTESFFGLKKYLTSVRVYYTDWGEWRQIYYVWRLTYVKFWLWKNSTSIMRLSLRFLPEKGSPTSVQNYDQEFNVGTGWANNVTLTQTVQKDLAWSATGGLEGYKESENIGTGDPISDPYREREMTLAEQIGFFIWNALHTIWESIKGAFPPAIISFVEGIGTYTSFALTILGSLFVAFSNLLPMFLSIYGLYLLIIVMQAIMEFSFDPIYNHFIVMYNFLVQIVKMLIGIAQTIYNFIKFW